MRGLSDELRDFSMIGWFPIRRRWLAAIAFGSAPPSQVNIRRSLDLNLPLAKQVVSLRETAAYREARDQDPTQYASLWSTAPFERASGNLAASFDAAFESTLREAAQEVRPQIAAHGANSAH